MDKLFLIENFQNSNKSIVFFGANHSNEPNQILSIKKEIDIFKPEVILLEGNYNLADYPSENEAILRGGSMGFASYLAKTKGINLLSNDPMEKEEIDFVLHGYGKEICFLYFFIRNFESITRRGKGELNELAEVVISNFIKNSNWVNYNYSLKNLEEIFKKIFKKTLVLNEDFRDYVNPTIKLSLLNQISEELSEFRDKFMLNLIKNLLNKYNRIFIIKGKSHLINQRIKIRELMK